jgi:O-antigen/teichoic acid export membrane protein
MQLFDLFHFSPQTKKILKTWIPLAASWLLMGIEMPAITAVMARLPHPEISLAAHGGTAWPIALLIEAPIIMLLSASVALSNNWASYQRIYRFMMISSFVLTLLHVVIAFTPAFDFVVQKVLSVPEEIIEPARTALRIMTPWTWSIAYRRCQQGVLIRYGHPEAVSIGTAIRLVSGVTVLMIGLTVQTIPGYVVGASAHVIGTFCEAAYAGIRVRPVLKNQVKTLPPGDPIAWKTFFAFYLPLALTSILNQAWQPIGSAALSRMPNALESLAVWSVVGGLVFMFRSIGFAYNEVVVALLGQPGSSLHLRRFAAKLFLVILVIFIIVAVTPLSYWWFTYISGITPNLVAIARVGFWLAIPMAATSVLQSWFQGAILFSRETRAIPEATTIFLFTTLVILAIGISLGTVTGLYIGMIAFSASNIIQTTWLWIRSRKIRSIVKERDNNQIWHPI